MNRLLMSVTLLAMALPYCAGDAHAGSYYVYRSRMSIRGPYGMVHRQPVVTGPSSYYAHPTAAEYLSSPLYNPIQHPLMPVYGGWTVFPGYVIPLDTAPYYYGPVGEGWGY